MRAVALAIHNYRSLTDVHVSLDEVSLVAGANNAGKTNLVDAIRTFYGDLKWDPLRDAPKGSSLDGDSWIEIEFRPSIEELAHLKDEYRSADGTFRVRHYFVSATPAPDGKARSGYYAYVDGALSDTLFYGAKNVASGKFGKIIYIPAVSRLEDHTKMSGPSALRDLITTVLGTVISGSPMYAELTDAFGAFERDVKDAQSAEGHSLKRLESEISSELSGWATDFRFEIQGIQPDELIKTLVRPVFTDQAHGNDVDQMQFGAGFQRSLIYSLIKLAAQYSRPNRREPVRKEFTPSLNWIIFEEPEAFLHPTQEDVIFDGLRKLATEEGNQALLTTHSSRFVSRSMDDLSRLIRLRRSAGTSTAFQLRRDELDALFDATMAATEIIEGAGRSVDVRDKTTLMSALKYELWLNPQRASAFFAEHVLLTEGPSEVAMVHYCTTRGLFDAPRGLVVVDCIGKWNINRFMRLLSAFGVDHSVLYDGDKGSALDEAVREGIHDAQSSFTHAVHAFDKDLEAFMGIPACSDKYRKPQNILFHLESKQVQEARLRETILLLKKLCTPMSAPAVSLPKTDVMARIQA